MTSLKLSPGPQRPEPVNHTRLEPDIALAVLIGRVLVADGPERQGRRDCVERGLSDRNADHGRLSAAASRGKRAVRARLMAQYA
jgi:hypothetical protein